MHAHINFNNKIVKRKEAHLPIVGEAVLYGRGVFTTLAIYGGRPFLWSEHYARLTEHAARAGINKLDFDETILGQSLAELIEANKVVDGRARITLLARSASKNSVWGVEEADAGRTDSLIITGERHQLNEGGISLTISPYRLNTHSPLSGTKSVNYLDHLLAAEEAKARDFDEAVMLNERGEIAAATMANIFWTTSGLLHTPALATGAIAGTTRLCVIELADQLSIPVVEGVYELAQLAKAEEVFLTSAGRGVAPVTAFDFRRYTIPVGSPVLRLQEAFRQLTISQS